MPKPRSNLQHSPHSQSSQLLNSHGWRKHWAGTVTTTSVAGVSCKSGAATASIWVYRVRIFFVTVLLLVACLLGYATFTLLSTAEQKLAESQFLSISQRALVEAQNTVHRRRWAGETMANILSEMYPSSDQWPFDVECLGYERLVRGLLNTSSGEDMGFAVHITPEQRPQFEDFAYDTYDKLGFPNGTGMSPFGRGVWGQNQTLARSDPNFRYHDILSTLNATDTDTENTDQYNDAGRYQSPFQLLTPIFRLDEGPHPLLLFNPHSGTFQGRAIDQMLTCVQNQKQQQQGQADHCGSITDIFPPAKFDGRRFGMILFLPIYPANDPTTVVGQITPLILVDELLENVFGDEVSGVDAVLQTENRSVTYTIANGVAHLVGEGDRRSTNSIYASQSQTVELLDQSFYTDDSPVFTFTLTPNDEFYEAYETNNPLVATVVTIGTIVLTSLAFFLYDYLVRREFNAKQDLLEARRTFMRFVSHEVRTPLNAVSMGLDLMQAELAKALDFESITSLRAAHDFDNEDTNDDKSLASARMESNMAEAGTKSESQSQLHDSPSPLSVVSVNQEQESATTVAATKQSGSIVASQTALGWFRLAHEIQDNTQGAVDILNDLLNYDKIEQGTLHLELEVLSMWDLIETSILEFKLSASSKQIRLGLSFSVPHGALNDAQDEESTSRVVTRACQLPDSVRHLKVIGDPVRLTQVVRNLMSNALKFTSAMGFVNVKVEFVQEDGGNTDSSVEQQIPLNEKENSVTAISRGCIEVSVEDCGAGMSQDQLSKLFQDGVQFNVNELQAGNGSGLGLYIAKGIVKQHKGFLTASSDGLGHGTTFSLVLPIWELPADSVGEIVVSANEENSELVHDSTAPSTASTGPSPLHVLVVDDVLSNRKLLRRLLENAGHTCDDADDGQKAVEMVKLASESESPYDSVLMDYEMPILNGPLASREIRRLGFDVYIVGITGNVLPEDIAYFRSCGANDVLPKPVKMADLDSSWMEYGLYASSTPR